MAHLLKTARRKIPHGRRKSKYFIGSHLHTHRRNSSKEDSQFLSSLGNGLGAASRVRSRNPVTKALSSSLNDRRRSRRIPRMSAGGKITPSQPPCSAQVRLSVQGRN